MALEADGAGAGVGNDRAVRHRHREQRPQQVRVVSTVRRVADGATLLKGRLVEMCFLELLRLSTETLAS